MEWLVRECMEAAGCSLEVRAAFVGEDILVCLQGRTAASWMCCSDGAQGISDWRWQCECDFFGFELSGT